MSNQTENISGAQSLEIIKDMIRRAQGNIRGSGFHFLLWGWVTVLANLAQFGLAKYTDYPYPFIVWLVVLPTFLVSFVYGYRRTKTAGVKTYSEDIIMWVWISIFITVLIISFLGFKINFMISPLVMLAIAPATFITGRIIKFKPLLFGGVTFWVAGIICFLVSYEEMMLVSAFAIAIGYLIPGYMLKRAENGVS